MKRIRIPNPGALFAATLLACCLVSTIAGQQTSALKIERIFPYETAIPGQVLACMVTGVEIPSPTRELAFSDFKIEITQDEKSYMAVVRAAQPTFQLEKNSSARKAGIYVSFVIPAGLREGEASLMLAYQNLRTNSTKLTIVSRPPAPRISARTMSLTPSNTPPKPPAKDSGEPVYKFERGKSELIDVLPLIDPQEKDAAILVTFKQGKELRQTTATVKYIPATQNSGNEYLLSSSSHYETYVKVPDELLPGDALMDVQLRMRGQTSDSASVPIFIVDSAKADEMPKAAAPRILAMNKKRVGLGQSVQLLVERLSQLEPNPGQVVVVLEQNGERYQLKPEFNSATAGGIKRGASEPVMLSVRVRADLIGQVKVRVFNPTRGEELGLSEAMPLEILGKVIPPTDVIVRESTSNDLELLRRMRETALKSGRKFPDYDPELRYLTIQANDLEMQPQNLFIQLEWEGKNYQIKPQDVSLTTPEWIVFRLPDDIKPGMVQITVANRGTGNLSETVTKTVEITKPSSKQ